MRKNLVFVVGLSTTLADEKILRKGPYFGNIKKNNFLAKKLNPYFYCVGKFGKIMKVAVNQATGYAGVQVSLGILKFYFFRQDKKGSETGKV